MVTSHQKWWALEISSEHKTSFSSRTLMVKTFLFFFFFFIKYHIKVLLPLMSIGWCNIMNMRTRARTHTHTQHKHTYTHTLLVIIWRRPFGRSLRIPHIVLCMSPGQWSPQNPEGKKQYDREFLLKLQANPESRKVPNLPDFPELLIDVSYGSSLHSCFMCVWTDICVLCSWKLCTVWILSC